jgi:hypothetical protein
MNFASATNSKWNLMRRELSTEEAGSRALTCEQSRSREKHARTDPYRRTRTTTKKMIPLSSNTKQNTGTKTQRLEAANRSREMKTELGTPTVASRKTKWAGQRVFATGIEVRIGNETATGNHKWRTWAPRTGEDSGDPRPATVAWTAELEGKVLLGDLFRRQDLQTKSAGWAWK